MCFAPDKKLICTFRIRSTSIFVCQKRESEREGRERGGEGEREKERQGARTRE
jgi:hypothetical protein